MKNHHLYSHLKFRGLRCRVTLLEISQLLQLGLFVAFIYLNPELRRNIPHESDSIPILSNSDDGQSVPVEDFFMSRRLMDSFWMDDNFLCPSIHRCLQSHSSNEASTIINEAAPPRHPDDDVHHHVVAKQGNNEILFMQADAATTSSRKLPDYNSFVSDGTTNEVMDSTNDDLINILVEPDVVNDEETLNINPINNPSSFPVFRPRPKEINNKSRDSSREVREQTFRRQLMIEEKNNENNVASVPLINSNRQIQGQADIDYTDYYNSFFDDDFALVPVSTPSLPSVPPADSPSAAYFDDDFASARPSVPSRNIPTLVIPSFPTLPAPISPPKDIIVGAPPPTVLPTASFPSTEKFPSAIPSSPSIAIPSTPITPLPSPPTITLPFPEDNIVWEKISNDFWIYREGWDHQCRTSHNEFNVRIDIRTDTKGNETSIELWEEDDSSFFVRKQIFNWDNFESGYARHYARRLCLQKNKYYALFVFDAGDDGICCDYGKGGLNMTMDGQKLIKNGQFGFIAPYRLSYGFDSGISKYDYYDNRQKSFCAGRPDLLSSIRNNNLFVLDIIQSFIGIDFLTDRESDQYKAACWLLYEDISTAESSSDVDDLVQRFIMAVFYFAMKMNEQIVYRKRFEAPTHETYWLDGGQRSDPGPIRRLDYRIEDEEDIVQDDEKFSGTIPSELAGLTRLEFIRLEANLSGTIPSHLGLLKNLRVLDLKHNRLNGTIPEELFSSLINLQTMDLIDNNLSGTLSSRVGQLQNVEIIALRDNNLTGPIPYELMELQTLNILSLSENRFHGQLPQAGRAIIGPAAISPLKFLYLSNNDLSGDIPSTILKSPSILEVKCENNGKMQISSPIDAFCAGEKINNHSSSKASSRYRLYSDCHDWYSTPFECPCCSCKPYCLGLQVRIKLSQKRRSVAWDILNKNNNKTIDYNEWQDGKREACISASGCYEMKVLTNSTSFEVFVQNERIYNSAHDNSYLASIHSNNTNTSNNLLYRVVPINFSVKGKGWSKCSSFEDICGEALPHYNSSTSANARNTFDELVQMSSYERDAPFLQRNSSSSARLKAMCDLSTVQFEKKEILHQMYVLSLLHYINKAWANITWWSTQEAEIMEASFMCQNLPGIECDVNGHIIQVHLHDQKLSGEIPSEIGGILSLQYLDLSNNTLRGNIPTTFKKLNHLKYLDISKNRLTGPFPAELPASIEHLHLDHNFFKGQFPPSSLDQLYALENLSAKSNFFEGPIPSSIGMLSKMQRLDLSNNVLTGRLPSSLYSLVHLEELILFGNRFDGFIATDIGNLTNLTNLALHNNMLSGVIPAELSRAKLIRNISLNHNFFQGTIPSNFSNLTSLVHLRIHGNNKLSGDIPEIFASNSNRTKIRNKKYLFIADCGGTAEETTNLICRECTVCCNAEGKCYYTSNVNWLIWSAGYVSYMLVFTVLVALNIFMVAKVWPSIARWISSFPTSKFMCGDDSIYWLPLTGNAGAWFIFVGTVMAQVFVYVLFINSAFGSKAEDLKYELQCPASINEDETSEPCTKIVGTVDWFGWTVFGGLMCVYLAPDVYNGFRLVLQALKFCNISILVTGLVLFTTAGLAVWTSVLYSKATGLTNADLIINAVILLFVNEIDEKVYKILRKVSPKWLGTMCNRAETKCMEMNVRHINHERRPHQLQYAAVNP